MSFDNNTKMYGSLDSEKVAKELEAARQIVSEIWNFGVSDRQRLMIINLLALELENNEIMKELTCTIKKYQNNYLLTASQDLFEEIVE